MHGSVAGTVATFACWIYAAVWVAVCWMSKPAVLAALEPIVGRSTHSVITAGVAGLIIFGCAPFVREAARIKRGFFAIGIALLIAPGVWLALQGRVASDEIVLWLAIPAVIALWVLSGGKTLFWSTEVDED